MRRLGRILWTTFAAASLLLCVAAAGVWVRSYFVSDLVDAPLTSPVHYTGTGLGRVGFIILRAEESVPYPRHPPSSSDRVLSWSHRTLSPPEEAFLPKHVYEEEWDFAALGLGYLKKDVGGGWLYMFSVHLAYPAALFALAPLAWLAGHRKRRRRAARARAGLCAACGYDLRASPGRCPECGASAESMADRHGRRGERGTP